jgi:hypothetical protein
MRNIVTYALAAAFCAAVLLWIPPPPEGYAALLLVAVFVAAVLRLKRARTVGLLCTGEPLVVLAATENAVPALAAQALLIALVLFEAGGLPDRHEAALFAAFALPASAAASVLAGTAEPAVSVLLLAAISAVGLVVLGLSAYRTRRISEARGPAR